MLVDLLLQLRSRLARAPQPPLRTGRIEVCPPHRAVTTQAAASGWRGWLDTHWGSHARLAQAQRRPPPLAAVKRDFCGLLDDVRSQHAGDLQQRIRLALSLRELWHLRPEAYALISRWRDQSEAEYRLGRLNGHFPTRAPRSGFGTLDDAQPAGRRGGMQ